MSELPFTRCDVCNSRTFPGASCLTCHVKKIEDIRSKKNEEAQPIDIMEVLYGLTY